MNELFLAEKMRSSMKGIAKTLICHPPRAKLNFAGKACADQRKDPRAWWVLKNWNQPKSIKTHTHKATKNHSRVFL